MYKKTVSQERKKFEGRRPSITPLINKVRRATKKTTLDLSLLKSILFFPAPV